MMTIFLYTICSFTTNADVDIKKLDTGTLDTSGCSVVASEICITFVTSIWILIASVTFSIARWKSAILVFVFWNLKCRNALPVVQKRLCFPWIIIRTLPQLNYSLFETDLVERVSSKIVFLYSVRVTNAFGIVISTSWSAMRTTCNTWSRVVTYYIKWCNAKYKCIVELDWKSGEVPSDFY